MRKSLLLLLAALCCVSLNAQVVLEDFEGGTADLNWEAFEGTYNGVVVNTADTLLNTSEFCGSYTKAGDRAFSFFRAQVATPLDLSVNNQFSIQINAGANTEILVKLEGGGQDIEARANIATADVWRTYTFDFSGAAGFTGLTDIVLFFDPGVEVSMDTYLFDNIVLSPAGPCAGTVADPTVLDDFECQRNATYGVPGFDDIRVIANPDPSGINTSDSVGEYTDRAGEFHALVIDYDESIDLSVNNLLCLKVWAPVAGNLLFKIEGGLTPAFENAQAIAETQTWVEVCQDFSAQSNGDFGQITLFLNAGVDGEGDIYYLDDITLTPAPPVEALEDFEDGANLAWMPLNGDNNLHGTFTGPIPNPDATGENTSDNVGQYVRGNSMFATLTAVLPEGLDLSGSPQLNIDVWAPAGATSLTMQLQSPVEGAKSIAVDIPVTEMWTTLNFNFAEFAGVTDFSTINLLFDTETNGNGLYYFDNLAQGQSTVNACADVTPDLDILDDFECQRNADYTCCDPMLTVVPNPDISIANPSGFVGELIEQPGAFNALVINNGDGNPFDLSVNNRFRINLWAPVGGQTLFKLEGGTSPDVEIFVDVASTMEWNEYEVDFSAADGGGYTRLVLFFGAGTDNATPETYYIDDLQFVRQPYVNDCVVTFEDVAGTIDTWQYFANGAFEANPFLIQDNPDISAGNMSQRVGTFEEAADGLEFAGMFADTKANINLPSDNKVLTMKWWMPVAGDIVVKLEGGPEEAPQSGDIFATYTTPGQWQTLTFDMSIVPDGVSYDRIVLIPNIGVIPTEDQVLYFDDIAVGNGSCTATSLFDPVSLGDLRVFPNPVGDLLTIDNTEGATTFELTNMVGQTVQRLTTDAARTQVQWGVENLPTGAYVLTARAANGAPLARTKIVRK